MATDISRKTTNVVLPTEVSSEIWAATLDESAIMSLARQITIPGTGLTIQTITGEPAANWVDETAAKPIGTHTFGSKAITPYKLAVIEPFSDEFRRDKDALYAECVRRLPYALAKKFDETVLGTTAPGSNFDTLGGCVKQDIETDAYAGFLAADAKIAEADGIMNGIALGAKGKSVVLGALDKQGRPLFTPGVDSQNIGNILGAKVAVKKPIYIAGTGTKAVDVIGIAGDWNDAMYGTVEGIKMAVSDQATLTNGSDTINLFQQNMFAVRFEVEIGFAVRNAAEFVLLTTKAAS